MAETWNRMRSPADLKQAIDSNNKGRVRELVQSLVTYVYQHHDSYAEIEAESILRQLRRRSWLSVEFVSIGDRADP